MRLSLNEAIAYYRRVSVFTGTVATAMAAIATLLNALQAGVEAYLKYLQNLSPDEEDVTSRTAHMIFTILAQGCVVIPRVLFLQSTSAVTSKIAGFLSKADAQLLNDSRDDVSKQEIRESYHDLVQAMHAPACLVAHPSIDWDTPQENKQPRVLAPLPRSEQRQCLNLIELIKYFARAKTICLCALILEWSLLAALGSGIVVLREIQRRTVHDKSQLILTGTTAPNEELDDHDETLANVTIYLIILQCAQAFLVVVAHNVPLKSMMDSCSRVIMLALRKLHGERAIAQHDIDDTLYSELANFHCCLNAQFTSCQELAREL